MSKTISQYGTSKKIVTVIPEPLESDCTTGELCSNCNIRPGTETWVGNGGTLAVVHGCYTRWCKRCCLVAQIAFANESAERLPGLKRQLAEIDAAESTPPA